MSATPSTRSQEAQNANTWEVPYIGKRFVFIVLAGCLLIILASSISFFWGRERFKFGDGYILDNELWGTLGDFIGGILGTILAVLGFLMMYWTLKAQRDLTFKTNQLQERISNKAAALQRLLNHETMKQAELQRFNSLFFKLLGLYHPQISELNASCGSDSFFNAEMRKMQDNFKEYSTFGYGWKYAKDAYLKFYLYHATKIAPIFRTLFRLFSLIDTSIIEEKDKLEYAKVVRAQLSEGELFFLRYNCLTGYGCNFVDLINKYRITKHQPFLSLLENSPLRKKIYGGSHKNRGLALNWITYSLGKEIYGRLTGKIEATGTIELLVNNAKYSLRIAVRDKKAVIVNLEIAKGHRNNTPALKCIDDLSHDEIQKMLYDFVREILIYSNSMKYNDRNLIAFKSNRQETCDKVSIWSSCVAREGELRVSHPAWD